MGETTCLDRILASLASFDLARPFFRVLGHRSVPGRWQFGLCVEVQTNDLAGFRRVGTEDRIRTHVERRGFEPNGPRKVVDAKTRHPSEFVKRYYYLKPTTWMPLYGSPEEPAVVTEARERLRSLLLNEDSHFESPYSITLEFHEWASRNGHDVLVPEVREKHVTGEEPLWEVHARLVVKWLDELEE